MMNDVIVHLGWLVTALDSVHWCLGRSDLDGFLYLSGSSWLFINDFCSLPVYYVISVVTWSVRVVLLKLNINLFSLLLVYFSLFVLSTSFLCSSNRIFSSLSISPIHHISCMVSGTPCSASSTLCFGCTSRCLRVVWGRMAVATPYFFITLSGVLFHTL